MRARGHPEKVFTVSMSTKACLIRPNSVIIEKEQITGSIAGNFSDSLLIQYGPSFSKSNDVHMGVWTISSID